MIFLALYTIEQNYQTGYILPLFVTEEKSTLLLPEAQDNYRILYMESGTLHIRLNDKEYILTGAYALCLNERDQLELYDKSDTDLLIMYFKPSVINNRFRFDIFDFTDVLSATERQDLYYLSNFKYSAPVSSKILQLHAIDSSVIKQKLLLLKEQLTAQNSGYWPCRSRTYLFEILFSLVRPEEKEENVFSYQIDSSFSKLTVDVIYYLQTCYSKKLTIEKLAQIFHTNRTTLLADFKRSTGISINRYLTQLRMTMAAALLRDTELTINEICERTGFSDISYFSKSFKKEIQLTPSEYRRINVS